MTYQTTIIKLEGYGPWTLGLGSDREYHLQILQSKIYAELQELFSNNNGIVFSNRFDEFVAVTNKIDVDVHRKIYEQFSKNNEKIGISMTIGIDETPLGSNKKAHFIKNKKEYLIDSNIYGANKNEFSELNAIDTKTTMNDDYGDCDDVKILHMDINNSTAITSDLSSYEITNLIINLYSNISNIFLQEESLAFYLGGDNFMIIAKKNMTTEKVKEIVDLITTSTKINLNCGIGNGKTGRKAAEMATKSLDEIRRIRKNGTIIHVYEAT
ncbi:MAG: GTP cyclohydrolase IIa [Nitrosopumilus sp.]|nr:GTP cyclohydrolase IIa [Nitrosopumilus sp.]